MLFYDSSAYITGLLNSKQSSVFLEQRTSPIQRAELQSFNKFSSAIISKLHDARIPILVTVFPTVAHAALISAANLPAGYDPLKFGEEVKRIVTPQKASSTDIFHDLRKLEHLEKYFYPVDGHPKPEGNELLAEILARRIKAAQFVY
jgi:hypothetical protein